MAILDTVLDNERAIKGHLADIRDAAVDKGAVIPEGTDLALWASRIEAIPVDLIHWEQTNNQVSNIRTRNVVTIPEAVNGIPMGTTLTFYTNDGVVRSLQSAARVVIIPEYYQAVNVEPNAFISGYPLYINIEEIQYNGVGSFVWGRTMNYGKLWRFTAENMTAEYTGHIGGRFADYIEINVPKATGCRMHGGTAENVVQAFWNVAGATQLGVGGYQPDCGINWYGNVNAPLCATVDGLCVPNKAGEKTVYTLPSLRTINQWTCWNHAGAAGSIEFYIGKELDTINNTAVGVLTSATNITIHIPAGDSTTKTTLDTYDIPYVQDYVM